MNTYRLKLAAFGSDPFDIARVSGRSSVASKASGLAPLEKNCGEAPTNIDIYQLRAFGLPRPLRRFAFFNGCSGWVSIFRGWLPSAGKTTLIQTRGGRKETSSSHKQTFLISYRTISHAKQHELREVVTKAQLLGVN